VTTDYAAIRARHRRLVHQAALVDYVAAHTCLDRAGAIALVQRLAARGLAGAALTVTAVRVASGGTS
jgi:hypothetical protein